MSHIENMADTHAAPVQAIRLVTSTSALRTTIEGPTSIRPQHQRRDNNGARRGQIEDAAPPGRRGHRSEPVSNLVTAYVVRVVLRTVFRMPQARHQ